MFVLEPVNSANMAEVIAFTSAVFPHDSELIRKSYGAAVSPEEFTEHQRIRGLNAQWYYIARGENGKLVGTVGLYEKKEDAAQADWLGWFCVAPEYRRAGVGTALLQHAIDEAMVRGKKILRLYTSRSPDEAAAQELYEKMGFRITGEEDKPDEVAYRIIYREKILTQNR